MTHLELGLYLDILKTKGVASAHLKVASGELAVTFAPDTAPMPGEAPTTGGWKSPQNLDNPDLFEDKVVP